jgi:hypothetical protein
MKNRLFLILLFVITVFSGAMAQNSIPTSDDYFRVSEMDDGKEKQEVAREIISRYKKALSHVEDDSVRADVLEYIGWFNLTALYTRQEAFGYYKAAYQIKKTYGRAHNLGNIAAGLDSMSVQDRIFAIQAYVAKAETLQDAKDFVKEITKRMAKQELLNK